MTMSSLPPLVQWLLAIEMGGQVKALLIYNIFVTMLYLLFVALNTSVPCNIEITVLQCIKMVDNYNAMNI